MIIGDFHVTPTRCLVCDSPLEMACNPTGLNRPQSGDASICLYCGNVAIFDQRGQLRQPNKRERKRIERDPRIAQYRAAQQQIMRRVRQ